MHSLISIRKVSTASGSIAIQVVQYQGHKSKIIKHLGSSKDAEEVSALIQKAKDWINSQTGQTSLFVEPKQKILFVDRGECIGVPHQLARQFLLCCINDCGLSDLNPLLLDLAIMRLIEPASKLRTVELLSHFFGISYSQRIYRNIPRSIKQQPLVECQMG